MVKPFPAGWSQRFPGGVDSCVGNCLRNLPRDPCFAYVNHRCARCIDDEPCQSSIDADVDEAGCNQDCNVSCLEEPCQEFCQGGPEGR